MALILNIETSGEICSVALVKDAQTVALEEIHKANMHSELLTVFVEKVFKKAGTTANALDAVAVSKGPGSYTGLRIGVSACKGIAYAKSIPMIGINTLKAMAWGMLQKIKSENKPTDNILLCPMTDARRMEVYSAFYNSNLDEIKTVSADIIDENSYADFLSNHKLVFFGSGAEKCSNTIVHENAVFRNDFALSAKLLAALSEQAFQARQFEDTAYFEPFYLKNFVAQIPTKNVFGKF